MKTKSDNISFPKDCFFDSSVGSLTLDEKGAYFAIICHSHQRGGKLWATVNGGALTLNQLSKLLGIVEKKLEEILTNLVSQGCLMIDDEGVYYIESLYYSIQKREALSRAGRAGGQKSHPLEHTLGNLRNHGSLHGSQASDIYGSQASTEALNSENQDNNKYISLSLSERNCDNIYYSPQNQKQSKKEKKMEKIDENETPPGMPQNADEAVEIVRAAETKYNVPEDKKIPEWFIRKKAYSQAVASGWMMSKGKPIKDIYFWVENYWNNFQSYKDSLKDKKKCKNGSQSSSYMYNQNGEKELPTKKIL